jgi:isoamylase
MRLIAAIIVLTVPINGCVDSDYVHLFRLADKAPSLSWADLEAMEHMGPTVIDGGVNFCVYSENAERVDVLVFDAPDSDDASHVFNLVNRGDIWNGFVEGIGLGQHYGYRAWGPNWPVDPDWLPGTTTGFRSDVDGDGNRFNPNKLLFDPWGLALHREHDWSLGSTASGPSRASVTYGAAAKTVVVESNYAWSDAESQWRRARADGTLAGHADNELIIYEVHPKGLTMNPASAVDHPGTFLGIGEIAPYLQDLGVNVVELMPIHEKPLDGGYWGYNNLSFFAPELGFSHAYQSTGRVDGVIDEFKWMVDQLHQHDIEVWLDVVYNHTGEGGLWRERLYFDTFEDALEVNFDPKEVAGLYSYRGLDNQAWYALSEDGQTYWDNTGVGNQTRPNHRPMQRLIMDSLLFAVEDLHIDGFRFDLAGILGEPDLDYDATIDPSHTILQEIVDHPVMQANQVRLISEPWTAKGTGPGIGGFPASTNRDGYGWGEWNAHFRDWWRAFVNNCNWGDDGSGDWTVVCHGAAALESPVFVLNSTEGVDGGAVLTGSESVFGHNGRRPYHSVNFITSHDGFTLYDLVSYPDKQNACGLLNPKCCDDPLSVWCDDESGENHNRSHNWWDEGLKRQMMRNFFVAMMVSHGTPMLLGGDEWMRTQMGNNNAYSTWADNEWNWFRWGEWQNTTAVERYRMHDFVRSLIDFRKRHLNQLGPMTYGGGAPFTWKTANNTDMSGDDWASKRHMMIHYYREGDHTDPELAILINMEAGSVDFVLPEGRRWGRVIDTQAWFDTGGGEGSEGGYFSEHPTADPYLSQNIATSAAVEVGARYGVMPFSIVVLEQLD